MLSSVTYLVTSENRPDVLPRAVMLLHRLAVPIDRLVVKRSKQSPTLNRTLEAEVIAGQAERVAGNLMELVYVISVKIGRRRTKYRSPSRKPRPGKAG
jgi:acetolactate synthase small subunit